MNEKDFAKKWIADWNSHDLEKILSHYTDDFEITTPMIKIALGKETGTLKGKKAVKDYWSKALRKFPDLKFELYGVTRSVNSIVIHYKSVMNKEAMEVMFFNEQNKIYKVIAHYADTRNSRSEYIRSIRKRFSYYKNVGERAMNQLQEKQLFQKPSSESNSIAVLVNHLHGNMRSRWINFFSEDGEKEWRDRDGEFEDKIHSRKELQEKWEEGWKCLFEIIDNLTTEDLEKSVRIRGEVHSVTDAINRQLTHYAYHIGEIVYIAKMYKDKDWNSLTIPKGKSREFNRKMQEKHS